MKKIKNALLLILCYLYYLFRGSAYSKNKIPTTLLIIPTSKLGDLVCVTPMFRMSKRVSPNLKLIVGIHDDYNKLYENNNDIDELIHWEDKNILKNIFKLRKSNIDAAVVTTPRFLTLATLFLSGIKVIVSPVVIQDCFYQTKTYMRLVVLCESVFMNGMNYIPYEYTKILYPLGLYDTSYYEGELEKHLSYSSDDLKKIIYKTNSYTKSWNMENLYPKHKIFVAIHLGCGNKIKQWSIEKFKKVAEYLIDKHSAFIFFTGNIRSQDDVLLFSNLEMNIKYKNDYMSTMPTITDLGEMKAFISTLDLVIAVDTGLIYIAEAFNIPTINIIGAVDENQQPPRGEIHKNVFIKDRIPELSILNSKVYDEKTARKQVDDITPEMVIPFIDELLKNKTQ